MSTRQDKAIAVVIIVFFIVFVLVIGALFLGISRTSSVDFASAGGRVAIVELNGVILSSKDMVRQFKRYQKDKSIQAIVFRINSPGGGIAASQEIYEHVKRVRDSGKPVIASMASVAASGGYYVALGADSIMANPGTTTGSIGVIAEFPNFTGLLDKIGVKMTVIKSGRYKDTGSPYRDMTAQDRQYLQSWIDSGYDQFVEVVAREREMNEEQVRSLADGRVYTGEQAFELALIDTLGTFDDAIKLAATAAGIEGEPKLVRQEQKRVTPFDFLFSFDVTEFVHSFVSRSPRVMYMMFL